MHAHQPMQEAVRLIREGKAEEALTVLDRIGSEDGAPPLRGYLKGVCLARLARWHEARSELLSIQEHYARDQGFTFFLADIAVNCHDPNAAEQLYKHTLSLGPTHVPGWSGLAKLMLKQRRWSDGLALFGRPRWPWPPDPDIIWAAMVSAFILGRDHEAADLAERLAPDLAGGRSASPAAVVLGAIKGLLALVEGDGAPL
ncbi:MAG: hypothetical protein HQL39_18135, partial [Alphaproteobacteria bacterium]|nr:hypothetical protein [Alphaproteobacteria bacterium]